MTRASIIEAAARALWDAHERITPDEEPASWEAATAYWQARYREDAAVVLNAIAPPALASATDLFDMPPEFDSEPVEVHEGWEMGVRHVHVRLVTLFGRRDAHLKETEEGMR